MYDMPWHLTQLDFHTFVEKFTLDPWCFLGSTKIVSLSITNTMRSSAHPKIWLAHPLGWIPYDVFPSWCWASNTFDEIQEMIHFSEFSCVQQIFLILDPTYPVSHFSHKQCLTILLLSPRCKKLRVVQNGSTWQVHFSQSSSLSKVNDSKCKNRGWFEDLLHLLCCGRKKRGKSERLVKKIQIWTLSFIWFIRVV